MKQIGPPTLAGFLLAFVLGLPLKSQESPQEIVVRVMQKAELARTGSASPEVFLNGYRRSLSGQVMAYRSPHPDAETALLVRAQREAHSISWETDTLPAMWPGDSYRLMWLAGMEKNGFGNPNEVHTFDLLIDGERRFTFRNRKDSTAYHWTISGKDGAHLSFQATMEDRVGDIFGTMTLTVPKKEFTPGRPLVLEVVGEDAGSADWYMTFQYSFSFTPRLRDEPVVLRDGGRGAKVLRLSLDNLTEGRELQIYAYHREVIKRPLAVGANVVFFPVDVVDRVENVPVRFMIDDSLVSRSFVTVKPVVPREVYLLSYSHNDIGYTDLQPNIERKQWHNLDEALRLIKQTRDYPQEARYKWNMEVLWSLESYLAEASEEKRREVIEDVRNGSIGLNAMYANILTGLATDVEMSHFTAFARKLSRTYSVPITSALVSDIPGFTWGIVPALAHSGVKYFSISPNPGDRIGFTLETWGDKPFYWVSQSGQERILTWVAGASYASFHEGDLSRLGDEKVMKLMTNLDEKGYPYEIVQLPYTVGGDNGPPDPRLPDFVKRWNERYIWPRLMIATHAQMFKEFERRYGSQLPSFKGDFTPYWEDGAASSAFETAVNRRAVDRLIQGEALWSISSPASFPDVDYYKAWRDVILYDEHTWGAWNSISEPDLPSVKGEWTIKRRFALDADSSAEALLVRALPSQRRSQGRIAIDIYNTQSWPRTDVVFLSREQSSIGDRVMDDGGKPVPSQRLSTGELAVLVEQVPSLSAKRFFVEKGSALEHGAVMVGRNTLENGLVALSVDEETGAIRKLRWKPESVDLVDRASDAGLNEYFYVPGTNPHDAQHLTSARVRIKEKGNLLSSLVIDADAPGCRSYSYEVRLVDGLSRVEIINRVDKKAVREKEGVHFEFPFNVPGGQLRYNVADGIVRPEKDQLPGACKNFFSVEGWVDVTNKSYGVTWATPDAPLVEVGSITAEQAWMKTISPSSTFYSYVMNNYWHTNYKADQEGPVVFRYAILPHARFKGEAAARFGREQRQPLIAAFADLKRKPTGGLLDLGASRVIVSSIKPVHRGGSWLLYLYNPSDEPQKLALRWTRSIPVTFRHSDSFASAGDWIDGGFEMPAYGTMYIRVDRK
jgi:alpha-mannosidase